MERRLQPAQPAPGGRSHVRPFPRTAQWLGTPASAGTARRRRAPSRTAIPPDRATAWNAGFSRHSPPQAGEVTYGHPPGRRNGLERRLQPAPPAAGGRSHVRPSPRTAQRLGTPASAGTARRRRAKSRTATPPDSATAWSAGFSRHRPPQAGEVTYGHPSRQRNGLERRLQPAPPAAGGRSHVRPPLQTAQRLGTPASAGTARRRRAKSRTAIPPQVVKRHELLRSWQTRSCLPTPTLRALRASGPRAG